MVLTLAKSGGGNYLKNSDGKYSDCSCCNTHGNGCITTRVPSTLKLVVTLSLTGGPSAPDYAAVVDMDWAALVCGAGTTDGWCYQGGDVCICPDLDLREVALTCSGSSWAMEVVLVLGSIQQSYTIGSGIDSMTTVDDDPVYLTTQFSGDGTFACGTGLIKFYIEEVAAVPPECGYEGCNGLPLTIPLSYTINGSISGTLTMTRATSGLSYSLSDTIICDNGGGNIVTLGGTLVFNSGQWRVDFSLLRNNISGFVSGQEWFYTYTPGQIYSDFSAQCETFNASFLNFNTAKSGSSSNYSCGGDTYPFAGAVGTVPLQLTFN